MKSIALLSTLAAGLVVATASFAQSANTRRVPGNPSDIYQSYSLGHQSYPNPDRDYLGETRYPAPTRIEGRGAR
jgi:hypothetical protein